MRLEFHKQVYSDICRIMEYYEDVAGPDLADEFYAELRTYFHQVVKSPQSYAVSTRDIRRVNLKRFPFHFFFHR